MSKDTKKAPFPMFPGMEFPMPEMPDWNGGWSKADVKANWEKSIDRQKSYIEGSKDQYDRFFENMTGMLDTFAESLPEEMPGMLSWAKPPKSVRKEMKEWEKMANDYLKDMADTWSDFVIKSQEKACEQIPENEDKDEAGEASAEK